MGLFFFTRQNVRARKNRAHLRGFARPSLPDWHWTHDFSRPLVLTASDIRPRGNAMAKHTQKYCNKNINQLTLNYENQRHQK